MYSTDTHTCIHTHTKEKEKSCLFYSLWRVLMGVDKYVNIKYAYLALNASFISFPGTLIQISLT